MFRRYHAHRQHRLQARRPAFLTGVLLRGRIVPRASSARRAHSGAGLPIVERGGRTARAWHAASSTTPAVP